MSSCSFNSYAFCMPLFGLQFCKISILNVYDIMFFPFFKAHSSAYMSNFLSSIWVSASTNFSIVCHEEVSTCNLQPPPSQSCSPKNIIWMPTSFKTKKLSHSFSMLHVLQNLVRLSLTLQCCHNKSNLLDNMMSYLICLSSTLNIWLIYIIKNIIIGVERFLIVPSLYSSTLSSMYPFPVIQLHTWCDKWAQ